MALTIRRNRPLEGGRLRPHRAGGILLPRSFLVPVSSAAAGRAADLIEVAAQLAPERGGRVVVLVFDVLALGEELDAAMPALDHGAQVVHQRVREIAETRALRIEFIHRRTRDPIPEILAEARHRTVDAILLATDDMRLGARLAPHAGRRLIFIHPGPGP